MGRSPSSSKHDQDRSLNRGAWTAKEDTILGEYIQTHGVGQWRSLPKKAGEFLYFFLIADSTLAKPNPIHDSF